MLNWAKYSDQVFSEVVTAALEIACDRLREPGPPQSGKASAKRPAQREQRGWLRDTMPRSAKLFTPEEMVGLLRRLQHAHGDERTLYRCTDYHWLVFHEVLDFFADLHNDTARNDTSGLAKIGPYRIGELDFDAIVDSFFHDTDFLADYLVDAPEEVKRQLGISSETWGLVVGFTPHPDEVALTPITDQGEPPFTPSEGPRTNRLTTYPPTQITVRTEWFFGEGAAQEQVTRVKRQGRKGDRA